MRRRGLVFGLLAAVWAAAAAQALAAPPRVLLLDLDRVVHPLTAEIIVEGLEKAGREGDSAVILRINTPGGLLTATQEIVQAIVASPAPVVTYVTPSGGHAASAGFIILVAADVAAMAPGTNAGAAHPVLAAGEMDETMKQKVENDTAASLRAITDQRGRNSELAEEAVLESRSFTEQDALEANLIEVIAKDVDDLIEQLNGRTVARLDGEEQILELAGAQTYTLETSLRQKVLLPLIDPSVALVVLVLGLLGVYIEFSSPGLVLPGVLGGILALLGLMALSVLPIDWTGAMLLALAVVFFVVEAMTPTNGILAAGGAAAMTLGAVILIETDVPELQIGWGPAAAVTLPFAAISVFLLHLAVRSLRYKQASGGSAMIGEIGVAKTPVADAGRVFVHGEWWNARSNAPIEEGRKVRVAAVKGLRLEVEPLTEERISAEERS